MIPIYEKHDKKYFFKIFIIKLATLIKLETKRKRNLVNIRRDSENEYLLTSGKKKKISKKITYRVVQILH